MSSIKSRAGAVPLWTLLACMPVAYAAPPANSAYTTDTQTSRVEDATSKGIGQVNMIACIMAAMRPDALVNEDSYIALIDESKCDPEARSSTTNTGAGSDGAQAASFITATVNSSRASNSAPMIVKGWLDFNEGGMPATVFVNISATVAPSTTNPYGEFRLDFCGRAEGVNGCLMNGFIEGTSSGLNYFQVENQEESHTVAMRLTTTGATNGSGRMLMAGGGGGGGGGGQSEFAFAYDATLFRRADDSGDPGQCFSRDASDPDTGFSVWRYGLYDAQSGERITRNSGFPIEYLQSGTTYHGYLGYHGLSLPPDVASTLESGTTVQKVDYSSGNEPTRTNYEVARSGGKLTKYTKRERTLRAMDKIKFTTFVDSNGGELFSGATPNAQYEMYWNDAGSVFVVTGRMNCGQNGCQTEEFADGQRPTVAYSYWIARGGVQGWSQALGGEVFIDLHAVSGTLDSNAVPVVYRTQDLVYPSDLPSQLYCVQNCPTAASLQAYFESSPETAPPSPYVETTFNNWNPTAAANLVVYGKDVPSATLRDGVNAAVVYTNADAYRQHPQFQHGVRSGRLFENLAAAECEAPFGQSGTFYCDWKVNNTEVYYQWETGANPWNQFAAVKDSSGTFLTFDAPLQVNFEVPDTARYGQYRGKSIVLQYGGFGELWGIPGYCVSRVNNQPLGCESEEARYVPSFIIPYDETIGRVTEGESTYLVKWLDREIRFAKKSLDTCTTAGLAVPSGVTLPTEADLRNPSDPGSSIFIGNKPVVTAAPRVIHGDVKY